MTSAGMSDDDIATLVDEICARYITGDRLIWVRPKVRHDLAVLVYVCTKLLKDKRSDDQCRVNK